MSSAPLDPGADPQPAPTPVLVPFSFWLPQSCSAAGRPLAPDPLQLQEAMRRHLASLGWAAAEPLRWAIGAVDPGRGLRLEGVGLAQEAASGRQELP